ncbi:MULTISPECIES: hypothetical protein [unclassified Xenorhabdus]|uniref:hypothetical protein n=1 Tax=Xenorhabdus TaxID=626 RepID=UPI000C052332|nr:hypothetical protein [Xenorhabdus sp. KJ12.1]PHM70127.1 hypothetical protein Xekj_02090 [Xenorhabdus sp. KJ12.1]
MRILWFVVIIGSVLGLIMGLLPALFLSNSAPQEAAGAAIAVACSVVPYCIARAVSMLNGNSKKDD